MNGLLLLIACILFSAGASFFLKLGASSLRGRLDLFSVISNVQIWVGGICYASAFVGYIYLLRLLPLSVAQPAITAGVSVVTAVIAVCFLREPMAAVNWAGLLLICIGICLLFWARR